MVLLPKAFCSTHGLQKECFGSLGDLSRNGAIVLFLLAQQLISFMDSMDEKEALALHFSNPSLSAVTAIGKKAF